MEKGYLKVEVTYGREGVPAAAALVRAALLDEADGQTAITDASGKTGTFEFDAPDKALSLDPNYEGEVYTRVRVTVELERFKYTTIVGAQVFAGETAILPINIEPAELSEEQSGKVSDYVIPNHKVSDNLPNDQDVPPEDARILGFVFVPDYITVHLGRPDAPAQNVTVSFVDYIKNVCCSEIYPTWPENALRANIYCQISLALNRIFTEWYRSKGYSFDITNSTSFDQYFVYGRNIYENISNIVDGLFDQYLRKGVSLAPYYAEYCNGTTATCPGLSQWGTVTLANQGYSPLGIIRYYYGSQMNIYTAPTGNSSIESYPGTALRRGSTGGDVVLIQELLTRIRRNYPLIPSVGTIDGIFGAATEAAVRQFQNIFNLTADGVVGKATWYRISYIYVAVTKLAELGGESITNPSIISPVPSTVLRLGSTGETVSLAQYLLRIAGEYYETVNPITIDGIFGARTQQAVTAFQFAQNLSADGIIGRDTWNKLYRIYYSVNNSLDISASYPGSVLTTGSIGSNVALMQRYLNYIRTYYPSIPAITIDSQYGSATRAAVTAFQRLFGLTADGIIGRTTWSAIVAVYDRVVVYV